MNYPFHKSLLLIILSLFCVTVHAQYKCKKLSGQQTSRSSINYYQQSFVDNSRSDTFNIIHYAINLDITDISGKTINGFCIIQLTPKLNNISIINLDLLALSVDSTKINNSNTSYVQNGELITINLGTPFSIGDTIEAIVYYRGKPQTDASGWGGFYFSGSYAFNLGVGFDANPHTYGRVWFPCFDNFVERSTYEFHITTDNTQKAVCNGLLIDTTDSANGTVTWNWKMDQTIPTYLACVAVGPYQTIQWTFNSITGNIPIELYVAASDTADVKNSFINLTGCLEAFEKYYGAYQFDKVGYSMVPFSSGAMEHATNISYPSYAADGSLDYETLMAHELSHHWWGNLSTCETPEDMWLNEGWASYSEYLFLEYIYGYEKYKDEIRTNHEDVLHYAHINDAGYRAIYGTPHEFTYGDHVYNKGADVAHSLRGYIGNTLFFSCIKNFLADNSFKSMNSNQFRDYLEECIGTDFGYFFNNWVFNPGFPHFSIDSVQASLNGSYYDVSVYIRQRLLAAPDYFSKVPLKITFMDSLWNRVDQKVWMSGKCGIFITSLSFKPIFVAIDIDENISDAIVDEYMIIANTGIENFDLEYFSLETTAISDSALIRVEHNFIPPDRFKIPVSNLFLSDYRYWKIDGVLPSGYSANGTFTYNGRNSFSGGYLDNTFITNSEDSLVMLYRSSPTDDWALSDAFSINKKGSSNDKYGEITVTNLKLGEYTLGIYDYDKVDTITTRLPDTCLLLGSKEIKRNLSDKLNLKIYPNPSKNSVTIEFPELVFKPDCINIYNTLGEKVLTYKTVNHQSLYNINVEQLPSGIYFINAIFKERFITSQKIIIAH